MLVHRRVIPSIKFAVNHLYTWVKKGTERVKCLAYEHNNVSQQCPRLGLEPGPLDPESNTLTMRPPRLPICVYGLEIQIVVQKHCKSFRAVLFRVG